MVNFDHRASSKMGVKVSHWHFGWIGVIMGGMDQLRFDRESFLSLLRVLIGHSERLQNNPPELIPQEDLAADAVVAFLAPYTAPKGPLQVKKCTYVKGRSNLLITYNPDGSSKVVSFVGSHMDVVPANPEDWTVPPFELTVDGMAWDAS